MREIERQSGQGVSLKGVLYTCMQTGSHGTPGWPEGRLTANGQASVVPEPVTSSLPTAVFSIIGNSSQVWSGSDNGSSYLFTPSFLHL